MWKKPFKFAYLIFQKQRIIYSALALFMALSLALSPQNQIPAAAQANLPVFSLSADCTPDAQGTFTITNIGSDMTGPGSYTLLLNGTPIATSSFQLNGGSSTTIQTSGLYGTLELDVSGGGSVGTATVSTFCQSPTATPTLTPPTISLSANCTLDAQGTFTISNIGSDMTGPGSYTLLLNGTPIATNSFQLNAGASTTVHTSGLYGTLELDASGGGSVGTATVSTFCQSPTSTPTITPSVSVTPTMTSTLTPTTTITPTSSLTPTNTPIATSTRTPTATSTPSDTRTGTLTATRTPTMTRTGTLKATKTPTKTSTHAFTATHRPYQTSTGTLTREPTRRGTYKPTKTSIPTLIHSLTPTPTRRKDYHPTAKGTHVHYYTLTPRPTKTHREDDSKSNSKKLKASGISAEIGKGGSVPINWFDFLVQSLTRIWLSLLVFSTVLAIRLR